MEVEGVEEDMVEMAVMEIILDLIIGVEEVEEVVMEEMVGMADHMAVEGEEDMVVMEDHFLDFILKELVAEGEDMEGEQMDDMAEGEDIIVLQLDWAGLVEWLVMFVVEMEATYMHQMVVMVE